MNGGKMGEYLWNIQQEMYFQIVDSVLQEPGWVYLMMWKINFCKILILKELQGVFHLKNVVDLL